MDVEDDGGEYVEFVPEGGEMEAEAGGPAFVAAVEGREAAPDGEREAGGDYEPFMPDGEEERKGEEVGDGYAPFVADRDGCGEGGGASEHGYAAWDAEGGDSDEEGSGDAAGDAAVPDGDAAEPSADGAGTRDWNGEAQDILDALEGHGSEDDLARTVALGKLMRAFTQTALRVGKTIIREVALPVEEKTIKPADVGGIAGGSKFISGGIFFKFVLDDSGLYGSDESALKAARHDLKGARAYLQANVRKLRTPLMALLDFRGFRLMASALLPLSSGSLAYGSDDQGRTVHMDNPELNQLMAEAAAVINIKAHRVGRRRGELKLLHSAVDVEGHTGSDGRFYVLDTARTLPAERPRSSACGLFISPDREELIREVRFSGASWREQVEEILGGPTRMLRHARLHLAMLADSDALAENVLASRLAARRVRGPVIVLRVLGSVHLYQLLRPELVRSWEKPLSPDAFAAFGRWDWRQHNPDASAASDSVQTEQMPRFIRAFWTGQVQPQHTRMLTDGMRQYGINLRYLGALRARMSQLYTIGEQVPGAVQKLRLMMLAEMVSRTVKVTLRVRLRSLRSPSDGPALRHVHAYFNLIFGRGSPAGKRFWSVEILAELAAKYSQYGPVFSLEERYCQEPSPGAMETMQHLISRRKLLQPLLLQCGLLLQPSFISKVQRFPAMLSSQQPFQQAHFEGFFPFEEPLLDSASIMRKLADCCDTPTSIADVPADDVPRVLSSLEKYRDTLAEVFGVQSQEVVATSLTMAKLETSVGALDSTLKTTSDVLATLDSFIYEQPESLIVARLLRAQALELGGRAEEALDEYSALLSIMAQQYEMKSAVQTLPWKKSTFKEGKPLHGQNLKRPGGASCFSPIAARFIELALQVGDKRKIQMAKLIWLSSIDRDQLPRTAYTVFDAVYGRSDMLSAEARTLLGVSWCGFLMGNTFNTPATPQAWAASALYYHRLPLSVFNFKMQRVPVLVDEESSDTGGKPLDLATVPHMKFLPGPRDSLLWRQHPVGMTVFRKRILGSSTETPRTQLLAEANDLDMAVIVRHGKIAVMQDLIDNFDQVELDEEVLTIDGYSLRCKKLAWQGNNMNGLIWRPIGLDMEVKSIVYMESDFVQATTITTVTRLHSSFTLEDGTVVPCCETEQLQESSQTLSSLHATLKRSLHCPGGELLRIASSSSSGGDMRTESRVLRWQVCPLEEKEVEEAMARIEGLRKLRVGGVSPLDDYLASLPKPESEQEQMLHGVRMHFVKLYAGQMEPRQIVDTVCTMVDSYSKMPLPTLRMIVDRMGIKYGEDAGPEEEDEADDGAAGDDKHGESAEPEVGWSAESHQRLVRSMRDAHRRLAVLVHVLRTGVSVAAARGVVGLRMDMSLREMVADMERMKAELREK
eukprot:PLAT6799.1.p1 GENE.PLAT6799.1~~PLAT6799.1.p1  ORF type:complete len:1510 (+),score=553.32 PLAT6799.1:376-4530(+)